MTTLTGGCQCGAVRFSCESLGRASICHCRMCQKAFGGHYGPLVTAIGLVWTRGEPKRFRSSNKIRRGFCADCGTPLTYEPDGYEHTEVALGAFDRWHEGVGAGGQHQLVVAEAAVGGDHLARLAVDAQHRAAQVQGQTFFFIEGGGAHGQGLGIAAAEVLGQVHAVVGALRLLTEHFDAVVRQGTAGEQLLDAVVADHAVADDDQSLLVSGGVCAVHSVSRPKLIRFFRGK